MTGQASAPSLAPHRLCLLGILLLTDASARPANRSSAREERELLPPAHLNGVKLEADGHLNRDFHQEVFLGRDRAAFEEEAEPRRSRRKLMVIFSKVDVNVDRKISAKEMQRWIMEKTAEHFQEAVKENKLYFRTVDPDGDGRVSWDEYKVKFLASKGHDEGEVAEKIKNNEELKIDEETQEVLENLRDRWFQADNPPADLLLTEDEFLAFLHPEHSRGTLQFMVREIVRDLDQDGDRRLSLSEFVSLPAGTVENRLGQDVDDSWVRDRRKEFEELIDTNHDGLVTTEELEAYMDPMNEYNALSEAKQMIAIADENQNRHLEPEEVLKYSEFFTGSKLVDYARSVHEEF
ncbi:45 kDa calcium-binding protein [Dasypus novemcinctus]|uniref:45 kDa calcium-binding protein n=1 Tax=Dasypus novemcinctus TaxID=9361 RepID=UPI00265F7653|nr:45 kDa calcium-binding protein [Dasypus novemcinctus]